MVNNAESNAPVVQWSAICFFIVCSIHLTWVTRSVNWVSAFPQAPSDEPTLMSTPRGFVNECSKGGCLKVLRSLHRSKFAPRNWHLHLHKAPLKLRFRECPFNKCLFHKPSMFIVLHADNAGMAASDKESINNPVKEL